MIVHRTYAEIFEETVQNVIICENYEMANWLARSTYGDDAFAVDCSQYPCAIGGRYRDGTFYRTKEDGTESVIEPIPTLERQVQALTNEYESINEYNVDLDYQLSLMKLGL